MYGPLTSCGSLTSCDENNSPFLKIHSHCNLSTMYYNIIFVIYYKHSLFFSFLLRKISNVINVLILYVNISKIIFAFEYIKIDVSYFKTN